MEGVFTPSCFYIGDSMKYSLVSHLTIRREWFGTLISNPRTGDFHQFDEHALFLFSLLQLPKTFEELELEISTQGYELAESDLNLFLEEMLHYDIVTKDSSNSGNTILYLDQDVPNNYLVAPSSVTIYITQYCGKSCRHCVTKAHPKILQSEEYSIIEWKEILLDLKEMGVMSIVFTGGEPLKKHDIFAILDFADSLDFRISLLTDLDDIDESTLNKLKKLKNLSDLQTSLDGGTPESHDFIRGNGSFTKTLKRLTLLKESGLEYTISCSINSVNFPEIDLIADISKEYGARYLYINPVAPYGRAKKMMKDYLLSEEQLYFLAQKYLEIMIKKGIDPGNHYWNMNLSKFGDEDFNPFGNAFNALSLGVYNFSIGQKGECYLDSKMKAEDLLYLGNAITDSLVEMWNSRKLDKLRETALKGRLFIDINDI